MIFVFVLLAQKLKAIYLAGIWKVRTVAQLKTATEYQEV
jgi:hypothetical protein